MSVEELLADGMALAKAKMVIHKDKGSWEYKSHAVLIAELRREVAELEAATSREDIMLECGDIINYACMIIDNIRRKK